MQRKGRGDVVYLWFSTGWQQNFYDVHAAGYRGAQPPQPEPGGAAQQLALVFVDATRRTTCTGMQGAFHFCKHQHIIFPADDIHLPAMPHAETPPQYLVPLRAKPGGCYQLSVFTQIAAFGGLLFSPGAAPVV